MRTTVRWKHLSVRTGVNIAGQVFPRAERNEVRSGKKFLKLTLKWRLELLVDFHLITGDEFVGLIGYADDGLELLEHGGGHAFAESGSRVRGDAVVAVVGDADRDVDQFLGEGIEGAGRHDVLQAFPGAFEQRGIVGDGLPEIVDPIDLAGGHDVVVDGADFWGRVLVLDECECGHKNLRETMGEMAPS